MLYLLVYPIGLIITILLWRFIPGFEKFIRKTVYDITPVTAALYWPWILIGVVSLFILRLIFSTIGSLTAGKWDKW